MLRSVRASRHLASCPSAGAVDEAAEGAGASTCEEQDTHDSYLLFFVKLIVLVICVTFKTHNSRSP